MPDIFDSHYHQDHPDSLPLSPVDEEVDPELVVANAEIVENPDTAILDLAENQEMSSAKLPIRHPDKPNRPVEEYSEVMRHEESSSNPLDAFAPKPLSIFFDSQEKAERVLLLLRKHPITQLGWIVTTCLLFLAPAIFATINFFGFLPEKFQVAGLLLWYVIIMGFVLESFLTWFFNVYIITDERIIDVDFLSLIYKNITAAKIDNIEDITAETGGAIRSIYNFGTVKIQTAGTNAEIEFEVTRLLNELLLEEEREKIEGRVNWERKNE